MKVGRHVRREAKGSGRGERSARQERVFGWLVGLLLAENKTGSTVMAFADTLQTAIKNVFHWRFSIHAAEESAVSKLPEMASQKICTYCGVGGTVEKCPCNGALYCGAACQEEDWKKHKKECSVAARREVDGIREKYGNDHCRVPPPLSLHRHRAL
jgi:hypothetical protein